VVRDVDTKWCVALLRARADARIRETPHELAVFEDRQRIARDLHDTVVQRLFATALSLQAGLPEVTDPDVASRIETAIEELDSTIRHIRTAIFDLEVCRTAGDGLRARVVELVHDTARSLGFEPRVFFTGAVDTQVPGSMTDDLLATAREALSNVARHAQATRVDVEVDVSSGVLVLEVIDDGVGFGPGHPVPGNGLTNMQARAELHAGSFEIARRTAAPGTRVLWTVPMTDGVGTGQP
jgi:signal transduction histidine kinase